MIKKSIGLAGCVFGLVVLAAGACHSGERSVSNSSAGPRDAVAVEAATGFWRIVSRAESGEGGCLLALNHLPVADAYGVHLEACSIGLFKKAAAWRPVEGGFELLGPEQAVIIRFRQMGEDVFTAADGRYRMEREPLA